MTDCRNTSTEITKIASEAIDVVMVNRPCFKKYYITAYPDSDGNPYSMFERLARFVHERDAQIVAQDVYGNCELHTDGIRALERTCGKIEWPVTWIEGDSYLRKALTGTQAYAIAGTSLNPIKLDGKIINCGSSDVVDMS